MALGIGIVGLPNVGKSTLFNALTREQNAEAANYPFCTIEPNKAIVPVPDERITTICDIVKPKSIQNATVEFVDIAGLVKGASQGEGLGNQFLGNIRETAAVLHVLRCFDDGDVIHVENTVDPVRDAEIIELELALADMQAVEKRLDKLKKQARGGDKVAGEQLEKGEALHKHLNDGNPAISFEDRDTEAMKAFFKEMALITDKRIIYCANVDEGGLEEDNDYVKQVREYAAKRGAEVVKISAKVEEEMVGMDEEERLEFLASFGAEGSGLDQVIQHGYKTLNLISYFTAGEKEVRAWTIERGWTAPQAAGVIHTDFERGFIRAETIAYADYESNKGEAGAKSAGVMRVEGKEYIVQDGDVMHFRFNV